MDFTKQSPVILSLCPGMRGLERGLERACKQLGWFPPVSAAYVEIEAFIIYNLVKQMEQGVLDQAPIHSNIKRFPWNEFRGKIHGFLGGYPCQPFSLAGQRKGFKDPRHLWPHIYRGVQTIRPVFCFFENVAGHLNLGFDEVSRDLRKVGYRVEAGVFTAEEVGAPHQRERLFILGIREDVANTMRSGGRQYVGRILSEFKRTGGRKESEMVAAESKLADTGYIRQGGGEYKPEIEQEELSEELSRSTELADTEMSKRQQSINSWSGRNGLTNGNKWPARPGQTQHEYEEPRIESRMGFTVNGYNFREDLLRMAGNGVVEDTAEIAFTTLLAKFK